MDIKSVIKSYGWTVSSLAKEMPNRNGSKGIRQTSMSAIINGNPTVTSLIAISKIVGCSVSELVGEENTEKVQCPFCGKPLHIRIR